MRTPQLFKNLYNLEKQPNKTYNYNIEEFKKFLKNFNNPQNNIGKIIHIAGTNGKGSVAHLLSQALTLAGYKVGLYTSPHIFEINERIRINNKPISDYLFKKYEKIIYSEIQNKKKDYRTFFEAITALSFLYFRDQKTDFSIIETGLGGRLDSTNVITPYISVITRIDYDHMQILGNTIEKITKEKCGIIKNNIPVFTFSQNKNVIEIIKKYSKRKNSQLFITNTKEINIIDHKTFIYKNNKYRIKQLGNYQKTNSALCIDILNYINIDNNIIKKSIYDFNISGRMEIVKNYPIIIIDGSHNPAAISMTLKEIKNIFPKKEINIIAIFMKDKNYEHSINIMKNFSKNIILTTIPFFRSAKKSDFNDISDIIFIDKPKNAYKYFLQNKNKKNSLLLFIGSFYFIQYIKKIIN